MAVLKFKMHVASNGPVFSLSRKKGGRPHQKTCSLICRNFFGF